MSYHPRIESRSLTSFITSRCKNSELWFVNNRALELSMLGYLSKYKDRYGVKLYAFAIEGSHTHATALFPNGRRADFMRDFNSNTAKAVARYALNYPGGRLFERRYSNEFCPEGPDVEEQFFYTVLQPVQDCLVTKLSDYPFYNCFSDAVNGIERKYEVIRWSDYYNKKRYNQSLTPRDFTDIYTLKYERLPGYEHLSQREYSKIMHQKLEERRAKIVKEKLAEGRVFLGREALLRVIPGTPAKNPKRSSRESHRPRILSVCALRREQYKSWYFDKYFTYKKASTLYRAGERNIQFPEGMYPPWIPCSLSP